MQRIAQWVTYPPNLYILISAAFIVMGISTAFLFTPVDRMIPISEDAPRESPEGEDSNVAADSGFLRVIFGRPWIALSTGIVFGLMAFRWQAYMLELHFGEVVAERSGRILTYRKTRSFAGPKRIWPMIFLIIVVFWLILFFEFSIILASFGMIATMAVTFPIERRIFDTVLAGLTDPTLEPKQAERGRRWILSQRTGSSLAACAFLVMIVGLLVLIVVNREIFTEFAEIILNDEEF